MALTVEINSAASTTPMSFAPHPAEGLLGDDVADFQLAGHGVDGRSVEKGEVEQQVQAGDQARPQCQGAGQVALRIRHFAGEVGGRVPARVGVVDVDEGHREGAAEQQAAIAGHWPEGDRLPNIHRYPDCAAKAQDQRNLQAREPTLHAAAAAPRAHVGGGQGDDEDGGARFRRQHRHRRAEIGAKGNGGQRGGGGKADGRRNPAGNEAHRRMVDLAQEVVLAPGAGQRGTEFSVAERAAQGGEAAHGPEHQQHEAGLDVEQLEPETGEHPGADHVGHHHGGSCGSAELCLNQGLRLNG